jgi:predicted nucleic acid-binding protein
VAVFVDTNGLLFSIQQNPPWHYAPRFGRSLRKHSVRGVQVHDARIAAAMQAYGINRLLTYNPKDFARYGSIATIHPRDVA